MKKKNKLLVAALVLAGAFFASCSMMEDATVAPAGNYNDSAKDMTIMKGFVSNLSEYVKDVPSENSVRTITPEADAKSYKYYLAGKTNTGIQFYEADGTTPRILPVSPVAPADSTTDNPLKMPEFSLTIPSGAWDLTLVAVDTTATQPTTPENLKNNASLVAYAYADLTMDTKPVTFTLSPDGLGGVGTVDFDIYLSNDSTKDEDSLWDAIEKGYTVTAEVQDLITGEVKNWDGGSTSTNTTLSWGVVNTGSKKAKTHFGGSALTLKPGTYNFVVKFTKGSIVSIWSDILLVLPTKATTQDVFIPDLLGKIPGDVTKLEVTRIRDSEDMPDREGFYIAHFAWDDSISNERYYKIELAEVDAECTTDTLTSTTDGVTSWVDAVVHTYKTYGAEHIVETPPSPEVIELRASDEYYSSNTDKGSLLANNKSCSIYVPLGKALLARIKAVNNIGDSKNWCYATLPTTPTLDTTYKTDLPNGKANSPLVAFTDPTDTSKAAIAINRFRITYDLNGGKYKDPLSLPAGAIKNTNRIVYWNLASFATRKPKALWAANLDTLVTGSAEFTNWATELPVTNRIYKAVTYETPEPETAVGDYAVKVQAAHKFVQTPIESVTAMRALIADDTGAAPVPKDPAPASTDVEALDKGGYIGFDNLLLYADYSSTLKGTIDQEDPRAQYYLATEWIKLISDADTGSATSVYKGDGKFIGEGQAAVPYTLDTTGKCVVSRAKEAKLSKVDLKFAVALPAAATGYKLGNPGTTYKLRDENYTATVKMRVEDPTQRVWKSNDTKVLADGSTSFVKFNIDNWDNGYYNAYFDMVIKTSGRTITRSCRVKIEIVD